MLQNDINAFVDKMFLFKLFNEIADIVDKTKRKCGDLLFIHIFEIRFLSTFCSFRKLFENVNRFKNENR